MATVKITVTLPDELVDYIKQQVAEHRYESVSAYMTRAAENLRDFDPLDWLITAMISEAGEPGPEADAWLADAMAKAEAAQRAKAQRDKEERKKGGR